LRVAAAKKRPLFLDTITANINSAETLGWPP